MITLIVVSIVLLFGFVIFFGAPYLPTLKKPQEAAFDLLNLKPGQTLIELGCGDGRIVRDAAKRGLNVTGYEINPLLVIISKLTTRRYKNQVKIVWGSFWTADWPDHDGIYVFLLDKYMEKLDQKIKAQSKKGVRVASNTFKIPGKKTKAEQAGVYLYIY